MPRRNVTTEDWLTSSFALRSAAYTALCTARHGVGSQALPDDVLVAAHPEVRLLRLRELLLLQL